MWLCMRVCGGGEWKLELEQIYGLVRGLQAWRRLLLYYCHNSAERQCVMQFLNEYNKKLGECE